MTANSSAQNNVQSIFTEFFGGGLAVATPSGGFSTTLDPTTGTYKTTISAPGVTVAAGGVGQNPVSLWTQLTTTTGGVGIFIILAMVGLVAFFFFRRGR